MFLIFLYYFLKQLLNNTVFIMLIVFLTFKYFIKFLKYIIITKQFTFLIIIFLFKILITVVKLLIYCIKMCSNIIFKLYFLIFF